jgi:hypothetical protein
MARLFSFFRSALAHRAPRAEILSLADNEAISLGRPGSGMEVACIAGLVWVTQAGDPEDHVLAPGETIRLGGSGDVAMMAFAPARVLVAAMRSSPRTVPESAQWTGETFDISSR